jgi:formate dehydrogenase subunit gamma
MGSRELTAHAEKTLGVGMHGTNEAVSIEPTYCLGNCACSPAIMIDKKTHGRVSRERFDQLVAAMREGD